MNDIKNINHPLRCNISGVFRLLIISATMFLLLMSCKSSSDLEPQKAPNLLIIHTDEQTFRSISCYDNSWGDLQTPNIDKLAERGARFEKFYTNHPGCTPSRAALLTGRYAQKVDSYINDIPLKEDARTIGDILKQSGYKTSYIGKLHLVGGIYPGFSPERNFGFDDNHYMFNNSHMKKLIVDENGQLQAPGGIGDEKTFTTDFLTDRTIEFISKNKNKDWCCMVSFPDPHDRNSERSPYDTLYKAEDMMLPHTFQLPEGTKALNEPNSNRKYLEYHRPDEMSEADFLKEHKAIYFGMVKHIDDCVGRIISQLKDDGLLENTIIVYTSDHGDMMGEFSRYDKGIFYEASARIPFIMCYHKKIESNSVVRQVMSNIDFVPTILDLMNISYEDENLDGTSATNLITGNNNDDWKNMTFLSMAESVGVVTDRYKLVLANEREPWLIDLGNDPDEMVNAIDKEENRGNVKWLASQLKEYLENNDDPNWTDKLSFYNEWRYNQHRECRPPEIQNARKREVSWTKDLAAQLDKLIK